MGGDSTSKIVTFGSGIFPFPLMCDGAHCGVVLVLCDQNDVRYYQMQQKH